MTKGSVKEKRVSGAKKADRKAKKAQVTAKTFSSQINKNPPGII